MSNMQQKRPEQISVDQEVWLLDTVLSAMRMALELRHQARTGADELLMLGGLKGVARGAVHEIVHTLNLTAGCTNIGERPAAHHCGFPPGERPPYRKTSGEQLKEELEERD